jgi:DNA-binding NarL/FixJ family response regulator
MTSILIVDDQPLRRLVLRTILNAYAETSVVGEAAHGAEAVRLAAVLTPDVILMDIQMPEMDGIEATQRILASGSRSRVLAMTTFDLDEYAYAALRAGASCVLLKDIRPEELLKAIRAVSGGHAAGSGEQQRSAGSAEPAGSTGPARPAETGGQ